MSDQSTQDLTNLEPLGAGPTRTRAIEHQKSHGRFVLEIDGREVAVADYRRLPGKWNIVHTYTEPASRGYGVASDLVREVLGRRASRSCPPARTCPGGSATIPTTKISSRPDGGSPPGWFGSLGAVTRSRRGGRRSARDG